MTFTEGLMIGVAGAGIGYVVGSLLMNKTKLPAFIFKKERERRKLLSNPDLMLEKLNERKHMIKNIEITYDIEEIDGVRQLVESRKELSEEECNKVRKAWGMPEAVILREATLEDLKQRSHPDHPEDQEEDIENK